MLNFNRKGIQFKSIHIKISSHQDYQAHYIQGADQILIL